MPMPVAWRRPSLARKAIEQRFPGHALDHKLTGSWSEGDLRTVKFLLEVLSNVDDRILFESLSPEEGLQWRWHLAGIQAAVRLWQGGGHSKVHFAEIVKIYKLLEKCPDQIAPKAGRRLTFILDPKLQTSIGRDIDSLEAFLKDEEWKAATVIGGSVVEALLLDRLLDPANFAKAQAAEAQHITNKDKGWAPQRSLDDWPLWKMIAVAHELMLIDETVTDVCDGARDFRNLIHPNKERAEAPCDKGTAFAVAAAVENLLAVFGGMR